MDLNKIEFIKTNLRDLDEVLDRLKDDIISAGAECIQERFEAQKQMYKAQHEIRLAIHNLTGIQVQCEELEDKYKNWIK